MCFLHLSDNDVRFNFCLIISKTAWRIKVGVVSDLCRRTSVGLLLGLWKLYRRIAI